MTARFTLSRNETTLREMGKVLFEYFAISSYLTGLVFGFGLLQGSIAQILGFVLINGSLSIVGHDASKAPKLQDFYSQNVQEHQNILLLSVIESSIFSVKVPWITPSLLTTIRILGIADLKRLDISNFRSVSFSSIRFGTFFKGYSA
jgi:hypothetical protein